MHLTASAQGRWEKSLMEHRKPGEQRQSVFSVKERFLFRAGLGKPVYARRCLIKLQIPEESCTFGKQSFVLCCVAKYNKTCQGSSPWYGTEKGQISNVGAWDPHLDCMPSFLPVLGRDVPRELRRNLLSDDFLAVIF